MGHHLRVAVQVLVLEDSDVPHPLRTAARELLDDAFEGTFSEEDWAHTCGGVRLLAVDDDSLVSHAAVVPRTLWVARREVHAGYVEGVGTCPGRQGEGLGSLVMAATGDLVRERYQLGALSTGRHDFYRRLGWESWRGATYVLEGPRRVRTEDEDDGIMVLLPSGDEVDVTADIACRGRDGDDW